MDDYVSDSQVDASRESMHDFQLARAVEAEEEWLEVSCRRSTISTVQVRTGDEAVLISSADTARETTGQHGPRISL